MYNLHLSAEQLEIRDTVRDFVEQEVKPPALNADRLDRRDRTLLTDVLEKASQLGLRTLALPEDLGGAGADNLTCCIVTEELAAGDPDIAATLARTSTLGSAVFRAMTQTQRERFLPQFIADDRFHLAVAEHEPGGEGTLGINYHRPGPGCAELKTTAARSGDSFVINGLKDCVANAPIARLIAVQVKTPAGGVSTVLVPHDAPGLTVRAHEGGTHWFHGTCGEVELRDCRVPAANLLGSEGRSPLADDGSGRGIPQAAALNVGIGRAAYEAALEYSGLRVQGGRPIIEHQAIGTKLAEIAIRLEMARSAVWRAAWASDHPEAFGDRSLDDLPLTTMTQVFTAEEVYRATKDAAECFGAMGVMRDMPLQKYVHDTLVCLHSGMSASDAKLRIAEALAEYRRPALAVAAE